MRSGAAALLFGGGGSLLAACGNTTGPSASGGGTGGGGTGTQAGGPVGPGGIPLARRGQPVKLPIYEDNTAIASGLDHEAGPLKIYNWSDYLYPKVMKKFAKEFGVKVELTTFTNMEEAVTKLSEGGGAQYDLMFPTVDAITKLVAGKLIQPINLDYVPNLKKNAWPSLTDPFYDLGSQYTVPYVLYTTGIAWRNDKIKEDPYTMSNPYDIYWDATYAKGKISVFDDLRETISMALLHRGETDLNTEDEAKINAAKDDLVRLSKTVNVKVDNNDYTQIPSGQSWIHQAWSGDMVSAQYYLPKGTPVDVMSYWFPPDGRGPVMNDTMAVLKEAKNPVLAHLFMNYLLDEGHGMENFSWMGYQPPFTSVKPDKLVSQGYVPKNLESTIIRESDFEKGLEILTLTPQGEALWQNAWSEFKSGV